MPVLRGEFLDKRFLSRAAIGMPTSFFPVWSSSFAIFAG
ncbi:hypothetical protein ACVIWV_004126 [Bradyrhizobium diazoefficiens]|uniref:Uncharacterized protein n=1 Tax=Bradyrhizobium diazoefficiens TaxID=1355477 RepID=A0A0E4BV65_9BRAD|nr:hypothetical protein NK6_7778 [Bradyrhizobium diazoefficiens]